MVQAMIDIPEEANQILNIIKARYNLKTKSEAIAKIVTEWGKDILEPELRPEYIEKLQKINDGNTMLGNQNVVDIIKNTEAKSQDLHGRAA
jgi:hypothetical protein